jgi:hypothetical protein
MFKGKMRVFHALDVLNSRIAEHKIGQEQQPAGFSWIGGQGIDPNEQKTQQSPRLGFSMVLQFSHS